VLGATGQGQSISRVEAPQSGRGWNSSKLRGACGRSDVEGIEPTSNAAERVPGHPVRWRTVRHGTRSPGGSRFVANILRMVETCLQQGQNVLTYLTACCQVVLWTRPKPLRRCRNLVPDNAGPITTRPVS
jgi:hypothetical protein